VQNKANFEQAKMTLTAVQKGGCEQVCGLRIREKQSQFVGARSVPVRALKGLPKKRLTASLQAGGIVQNKANFPRGQMNANRCPPKDLGEKDMNYASAKTKPISKTEIASLAFGLLAMTGKGTFWFLSWDWKRGHSDSCPIHRQGGLAAATRTCGV